MSDKPYTDMIRPPRGETGHGSARLCVVVPFSGAMIFAVEDAGEGEAALGECWVENDGMEIRTRGEVRYFGTEFARMTKVALEAAQEAMDEQRRAARERTEP